MRTRCCNFVKTALLSLTLFLVMGMTGKAQIAYQNPQTGYFVVVNDSENLLNWQEKEEMVEVMYSISSYGNVAFFSYRGGRNNSETAELAESYYKDVFGEASGTLLFIDMRSRYLYIYSHGKMYDVVTTNYANTITDNVYKEAKNGNYGACAIKAYSQILSLLQGQKISQPMKYISNALLGVTIAFLISFCWVLLWNRKNMPQKKDLLNEVDSDLQYRNTYMTHRKTREIYNPQDNPSRKSRSGGGGGGGSFGGGSFGGGGGSSGGGGGHSF